MSPSRARGNVADFRSGAEGIGWTSMPRHPHPWFEQLFGFVEGDWASTQRAFAVEGARLRSIVNGRTFGIGAFTTPSLAWLRAQTEGAARGRLRLRHEAIGDVLELHARPENADAVFQVASQFNCLEFAGPEVVPEDGVTGYAFDPTQGPACSLAAAAATVVRNYFVDVGGVPGQTRERQLDNLDELAAMLGDRGAYWDVVNGYTHSDQARLGRLRAALGGHDREALLGAVKVGLHRDVEVTFATRYVAPSEPSHVTQVFCSALSCGYSSVGLDDWEPLATLVLDAAYEATLRAAVLAGRRKVWLTLLGGGAFGNRREWITGAIGRALARMESVDLEVCVAHYRARNAVVEAEIDEARARG
jgi:hypothetical protein